MENKQVCKLNLPLVSWVLRKSSSVSRFVDIIDVDEISVVGFGAIVVSTAVSFPFNVKKVYDL